MNARRSHHGAWARPTILIVECNPLNQRLATRAILEQGYDVEICHDGHEAVEATSSRMHLSILMDCDMQVMDGFMTARVIRSTAGFAARTPIIAMVALETPELRRECFQAGMSAIVAKPVDWSRIDVLLRLGVQGMSATLEDVGVAPGAPRTDVFGSPLDIEPGQPRAFAERSQSFRADAWRLFDRLGSALSADDLAGSLAVFGQLSETVKAVGGTRLGWLVSDLADLIRAGLIDDAVRAANELWDELGQVFDQMDRNDHAAHSGAQLLPRQTHGPSRTEPAASSAVAPAPWPAPLADVLVG